MAKVVYIMGKSSTGKDTAFKKLMEQKEIPFERIPLYTTRPIREGEHEGVEYHFTDEEGYQKLRDAGKIVEERTYNTVQGLWRYFTVMDREMLSLPKNYLMIGTLESYMKTKEFIGEENLIPIYIELADVERLQRALNREKQQEVPQLEEMCRRFLADAKDFSEEKIQQAGITRRFSNDAIENCYQQIMEYLREVLAWT
ncbi:MAG: guanylate kinase [Lachnospiraceae bacterium]|jgi:guanylate kinase|nr:guanylate kinase [Lachnospiraceae bacterium]MCR5321473.1 guanylate kinase [Lachnospiraceae bacterium]